MDGNNCMRHPNRPLFKSRESQNHGGWFSIVSIIFPLLISGIVFFIYYYILQKDIFPQWIEYIYLTAKVIIVLELIIASMRSLFGPIIAIALGFLNLYQIQTTGLAPLSSNDAWQLIIAGAFGFLITIVVKVFKNRG